jgi:hypothetical protein
MGADRVDSLWREGEVAHKCVYMYTLRTCSNLKAHLNIKKIIISTLQAVKPTHKLKKHLLDSKIIREILAALTKL